MNSNYNGNLTEQVERVKTKKFSINVLDILIIIVILASVAGIAFRILSSDKDYSPADMKEYKIGFSVSDIADTTALAIHGSDIVYNVDGKAIGTVIGGKNDTLSTVAAKYTVLNSEGKYVEVSYPDSGRVDAVGELVCKGISESDGRFILLGEYTVTVGDVISVHTETVDFSITVISIAQIQS